MARKDREKADDERTRRKEATLMKQMEEARMAFQGDFEKLDDEIKVQVKALK